MLPRLSGRVTTRVSELLRKSDAVYLRQFLRVESLIQRPARRGWILLDRDSLNRCWPSAEVRRLGKDRLGEVCPGRYAGTGRVARYGSPADGCGVCVRRGFGGTGTR